MYYIVLHCPWTEDTSQSFLITMWSNTFSESVYVAPITTLNLRKWQLNGFTCYFETTAFSNALQGGWLLRTLCAEQLMWLIATVMAFALPELQPDIALSFHSFGSKIVLLRVKWNDFTLWVLFSGWRKDAFTAGRTTKTRDYSSVFEPDLSLNYLDLQEQNIIGRSKPLASADNQARN